MHDICGTCNFHSRISYLHCGFVQSRYLLFENIYLPFLDADTNLVAFFRESASESRARHHRAAKAREEVWNGN